MIAVPNAIRCSAGLNLPRPDLFTTGLVGNLLVCVLGSFFLFSNGANDWVDATAVVLLWVLGLENAGMLLYARKTNNPFIIILVGITTIFYMGRIVSLLYEPYSNAFTFAGFPITTDDVNRALWIIVWSNLAIFTGTVAASAKGFGPVCKAGKYRGPPATVVIIVMAVMYLCNFTLLARFASLVKVAGYIQSIFLDTQTILLMAIVYLWLSYHSLTRAVRFAVAAILLGYIPLSMALGSRSGLMMLGCLLGCTLLAAGRRVVIQWSWLAVGLLAMPLALFAFHAATQLREVGYGPETFLNAQRVSELRNFDAKQFNDLKDVLRLVNDRMGFLDYTTVMVAGADQFSMVVNTKYYLMSIIDNGLTPGFDVFGVPRASHALRYVSEGHAATYSDIAAEYSSSQMSAYGESFVLCHGYGAAVLLFFIAFGFSRLYVRLADKEAFNFCFYRAVILLLFYQWLLSFGLDWMVIQLIAMAATALVVKRLFTQSKLVKGPWVLRLAIPASLANGACGHMLGDNGPVQSSQMENKPSDEFERHLRDNSTLSS